jgi:hypothetical protein
LLQFTALLPQRVRVATNSGSTLACNPAGVAQLEDATLRFSRVFLRLARLSNRDYQPTHVAPDQS